MDNLTQQFQQGSQTGSAQSPVNQVQPPANQEVKVPEPTPQTKEPEVEPSEEIEEISYNYKRDKVYGLSDIAVALDFAQRWRAASQAKRDKFVAMMGVTSDNQADVIADLIPSQGRLSAISFVKNTYESNFDENMTRQQLRNWMVELTSSIAEMDPEDIRLIVRILNEMTPDDYDELRYRRNMQSQDVTNFILDAVDSIPEENAEILFWTDEMLQIWPGKVQ